MTRLLAAAAGIVLIAAICLYVAGYSLTCAPHPIYQKAYTCWIERNP